MTSIFINDRIYDFNIDDALRQLSEQRRQMVLNYKHELGKRTCAAAYLLLCQALRQLYGIAEPPVFEYGVHGKPSIVGYPDIHFNLSHCREAVICAIGEHPVGVDIESVREYKESVARYVMNDSEMRKILEADRPDVMFTRLWTMKEAMLKRAGTGITDNLKDVLGNTTGLITAESPDLRYIYSVAL